MPKKETEIKHKKTFNSTQKVSPDGSFVTMDDGTRFRRTVLPSVATPKKVEEDLEEAFKEMEQMRTSESELDE